MDETLQCPGCGTALSQAGFTDRCAACDGAWIHEDALVGMLQERAAALVVLPWQPRDKQSERPCAVCGQPMQTVNLGSVALDRCAEHGVWFDSRELAALLAEAKHFKSDVDQPGRPPPAWSACSRSCSAVRLQRVRAVPFADAWR